MGCRNIQFIRIGPTLWENMLRLSYMMLEITGSTAVQFYQTVLHRTLLESKVHFYLRDNLNPYTLRT